MKTLAKVSVMAIVLGLCISAYSYACPIAYVYGVWSDADPYATFLNTYRVDNNGERIYGNFGEEVVESEVIWNNSVEMSFTGGNELWEQGVVRPPEIFLGYLTTLPASYTVKIGELSFNNKEGVSFDPMSVDLSLHLLIDYGNSKGHLSSDVNFNITHGESADILAYMIDSRFMGYTSPITNGHESFIYEVSLLDFVIEKDGTVGIYANFTATPEPATMFLLGFGLIGAVGLRRKFRK